MKILLLTQYSPFDDTTGANQRTKFLYESLCELGRVDVAYFVFGSDQNHVSENSNGQVFQINLPTGGLINRPNIPLQSATYTRCLKQFVNLEQYDVVVSRYVRLATKFQFSAKNRVVIDYDDAYYTIPWKSVGTPQILFRELIKKFNDVSTRWLIKIGVHKFNHYLFVNDLDRRHYPNLPSTILPNIPVRPGTVADYSLPDSPALLFVGLMTYPPNIEAIEGFIENCWYKILEFFPDTKLIIAGKSSQESKEKWEKITNCIPLGFVTDLHDVYRLATFSIAPIWSGGGSNIKVLESYMYGRAVVASNHSFDGLSQYVRRDRDILIAEDFSALLEKCVTLLKNPHMAIDIAKSGHTQINQTLSFDVFCNKVEQGVSSIT